MRFISSTNSFFQWMDCFTVSGFCFVDNHTHTQTANFRIKVNTDCFFVTQNRNSKFQKLNILCRHVLAKWTTFKNVSERTDKNSGTIKETMSGDNHTHSTHFQNGWNWLMTFLWQSEQWGKKTHAIFFRHIYFRYWNGHTHMPIYLTMCNVHTIKIHRVLGDPNHCLNQVTILENLKI